MDHRMKIKESKKIDKYLDLVRKQKKKQNKMWNMMVTLLPTEVGMFGKVSKGLERRLEEMII